MIGGGSRMECAAGAPTGLHILLAEDDTPSLCIINRLLTACGYRVTLARNGREALDVLDSEGGASVDLVLSDMLMPEVSGIELVDQVVHKHKVKGVPVVVMSSESSKEYIARALEAGAADYLIKPVQRSAVTMLWQHVRRSSWACLPTKDEDTRNASGASSSEMFPEPEPADSGCSGAGGWQSCSRSLPSSAGRHRSADLARLRMPALLPCMRVSLEIEPLDLTPRSVFDFPAAGALPSPRSSFEGKEEAAAVSLMHFSFLHAAALSESPPPVTKAEDAATWAANRKVAIEKFRAKRKLRKYDKCVRYESRRRLAEARPRVRGMFVKAEVAAAHVAEQAARAARVGCARGRVNF